MMNVDQVQPVEVSTMSSHPLLEDEHEGRHDDEESLPALPSLPPLPPQNQCITSRPRTRPILPSRLSSSRKRPLFTHQSSTDSNLVPHEETDLDADLAAAFSTSSDPAFFSSDETPGLENYTSEDGNKRRKKVYSGTWWSGRLRSRSGSSNSRQSTDSTGVARKSVSFIEHGSKPRRKRNREFKRNFDSGIFMADEVEMSSSGGSGTDLSSDGLLDELEAERTKTLDTLQSRGRKTPFGVQDIVEPTATSKPFKKFALQDIIIKKASPLDTRINEIVQQCLDQNDSDVDLTHMGIERLPPSITDLRTMIKPNDPVNVTYATLYSHLRLYLGNNKMSLFPGHLLKLTNMELLSIRQNQLTTIPDGIIDLKHLRDLNVSCNKLQFLPFSILKLCDIKLKKLQSEPNPWKSMHDVKQHLLSDFARIVINQPGRSIRRLAVAEATTFGTAGTIQNVTRASGPAEMESTRPSRSPFLGELVLRQLDKLHTAGTDLSISSVGEACSDNVQGMLHQLYRHQYEGRRICTFCDRSMVLPRHQWLEWWRIVDFNLVRSETNHSSRYEISPLQTTRQISVASDDSEAEEEMPHEGREEEDGDEDKSGLVLPFMRTSCGCRDQQEGLEEERLMFEELATLHKDKDNTGYRTWPSLALWKRR